jgi:hypothetical protein
MISSFASKRKRKLRTAADHNQPAKRACGPMAGAGFFKSTLIITPARP